MGIVLVANVERMQMLVEASSCHALQHLLREWLPELAALKREHKGVLCCAVDVDRAASFRSCHFVDTSDNQAPGPPRP